MIPSEPMLMGRARQPKNYLRRTLMAAGALGGIAFLFGSMLEGDRGLFAAAELKRANASKSAHLAELQTERDFLDKRVQALDPKHLDLDMLGEQARRVLSLSEPDEILLKDSHSGLINGQH